MPSYERDIQSHLAYSGKLHDLAAGHMQETQQLLNDNRQLQDDVCRLLNDNEALRNILQTKEEQIRLLEQRIADLEHAALTVKGPYIANQQINKQFVTVSQPRKIGRLQKKHDSSQLQLCL